MKPAAISSSGAIMELSMDGASILEIVAGWCSVFHQSTENLTMGTLIDAHQRQDRGDAGTLGRVVEGSV